MNPKPLQTLNLVVQALTHVVTRYETASAELTAMFRSLSKREILEYEKVAKILLEAQAFFAEEVQALRAMRGMGPGNLAVPGYAPPCPSGTTLTIWMAELKERVAFLTQERPDFIRVRGHRTADQIVASCPHLGEEDKGF